MIATLEEAGFREPESCNYRCVIITHGKVFVKATATSYNNGCVLQRKENFMQLLTT